ncbi:nickel-dependent hydrogenase large subunit [uncultured Thiodictyon sp.]|uniref:nickel-dependent hydrogenase large subunit n=1 Tax=uncultured Thiodictyon sp. TaxID=1846217 RepID=UPI002600452A|nr:nickel-dependent hydrogenase large subunit [uncultured Thiodictyon sp.]
MTNPAGRLRIQLHPGGVGITSTRPVQAARLLVGRDTAQTLRLLPALFSVCASAQATAAVTAIEQALGLTTNPNVAARRRQLVAAETVREHLWRILLDWPCSLSEPPDTPTMAAAMAADGAWRATLTAGCDLFVPGADAGTAPSTDPARLELANLSARQVFGLTPNTWLTQVDALPALLTWAGGTQTAAARLVRRVLAADWAGLGRSAVSALPELPAPDLDRHLAGAQPTVDAFVAKPTWDGAPRETSALTRQLDWPLVQDLTGHFGNGLLPRLVAQLTEVARGLTATYAVTGTPCPPPPGLSVGVGLAQVQAARGLLVHRVRLAGEHIAEYRILAPTEWNFHPSGVVAAGLAGIMEHTAAATLEPLARLFITAVDPCVDFDLISDHS